MEIGILYVDKLLASEPSPRRDVLLRYIDIDPDDGLEYAWELTDVWKPFEELSTFRLDGVLAITLTTERGVRSSLVKRMWSRLNRYDNEKEPWHGGDNYAIGVWGKYFFCDQWDDMEDHLHIRHVDDPLVLVPGVGKQMNMPRPDRWPMDSKVTQFRGAWAPVPCWNMAIDIFDTQIF